MDTMIMKVDTITQCNKMFLEKTLHPLVSLIEMPDLRIQELLQMDFYSVLMKGRCSQSMAYGQKNYDFSVAAGDSYLAGDVEFRISYFRCPKCEFAISFDEMKKYEKEK